MQRRWNSRSGQTLILFSMAIIPLFGVIGLVVDVGWMYFRKEAAQAAADATATSTAAAAYQAAGTGGAITCATTGVKCYSDPHPCDYPVPTTAGDNVQAGCMYADKNGFDNNGRQGVTIQSGVGHAPTSSGVTVEYWAIARVSERVPQLFSAVLGFGNGMVTARATTGAFQSTAGGCVIALNRTLPNAVLVSGNASVTTGCGVYVNSNNGGAVNINGGATITTTGGSKTEIVGGCSGCSGNVSPAPDTGVAAFGDPLAQLSPPNVGSCTDGGSGIILGGHDSQEITSGTMGVICGGINLGSHASLTLDPGLYIIKGGITVGAQATITGNGVTLYVLTGGVTMNGGATINLQAPSTGDWQGILFYQDRSDTTASSLVGGTGEAMNGVLYFPAAALTYTGNAGVVATRTTIIGDTITLSGTPSISAAATTAFSGTSGGVTLIE